ncbi:hypothetical protein A33Q_4358 [Indibacter alkaliphilus LW1]|uniref:Uncharacterized protein n=1 Tax=Indibacter alkaliphilus (strain CCUG 57479 / KCTC 22604 / LW1) TaxID=1189612 RepID=S2D5B7_INDAL|nr:hypothetical protein A33Q_4358 [Indibacter alkaliphilus LW1]
MTPVLTSVQSSVKELNHQKFPGILYPYTQWKVKPEKDKSTEKQTPKAAC